MTASNTPELPVPVTLLQALDVDWLQQVLAPVIGDDAITIVECVEVIRTVATKVRFRVQHRRGMDAFCLKGFLDVDAAIAAGGSTMIREADFYGTIAPHLQLRLADCVARIVDRGAQQGVIVMRDLIADGARMCDVRTAFSADDVAGTLAQLAALHAGNALLSAAPWITQRLAAMAARPHLAPAAIQELLDGSRSHGVPASTCNAERLLGALRALAQRDGQRAPTLLHGDCHAGNLFRTADGPGFLDWQLIQRGGWALDVAYHINALLPEDLAAREELRLLRHYLQLARALGAKLPDDDAAYAQYRESVVYGYYLWAITRRVEPALIDLCNRRLGVAVTRLDSYRLLGGRDV